MVCLGDSALPDSRRLMEGTRTNSGEVCVQTWPRPPGSSAFLILT
jgi:hypothetical protein